MHGAWHTIREYTAFDVHTIDYNFPAVIEHLCAFYTLPDSSPSRVTYFHREL